MMKWRLLSFFVLFLGGINVYSSDKDNYLLSKKVIFGNALPTNMIACSVVVFYEHWCPFSSDFNFIESEGVLIQSKCQGYVDLPSRANMIKFTIGETVPKTSDTTGLCHLFHLDQKYMQANSQINWWRDKKGALQVSCDKGIKELGPLD